MLNAKSFLAVDFGAGSLKLAEFEQNEANGLRLKEYAIAPLGPEGSQEATREKVIQQVLQQLLSEKHFGAKNINVCAPGFHVFSKFVKLPPVDTSKVTQIIQYEAQQNVPFPLAEVVWDYQILGTSATGELEVLLVAIKTDIVEGLFRVAESAGLRMQLVDVSPAALCNAFRYNYGDQEGCTMLLDIGAKTSNLLFFEKGKVYSRSINIGANSITQDFSTESKLPFAQAEELKIAEGFVSLGGAYAEPENAQQAAISKIARQVMTRLHIQVNQTIQFYRGQQGGSAPQRLFLSGGASVMPYTSQFFAEKLNVPVEYFNPFRNIQIDPALNLEEVAKVAHSFGEVVGLGLRNLAHCPVELNLMPESSIQRQQFAQKKPFLIAAVFSLILVVFAIAWFYDRIVKIKQTEVSKIEAQVAPLLQQKNAVNSAKDDVEKQKKEADKIMGLVDARFYWAELLTEVRRILIQTEAKSKEQLNTEVGIWIKSFLPVLPAGSEGASTASAGMSPEMMDPAFAARYGLAPSAPQATAAPGSENDITTINVICEGVNLDRISASANSTLAYVLKDEILKSPYFAAEGFNLDQVTKADPAAATFTFGITLKLKRTFKFKYAVD